MVTIPQFIIFYINRFDNGIKKKHKEGDNVTPKGIFKIIKIYYRSDKVRKIKTLIKKIKIRKNMEREIKKKIILIFFC